MKIRLDCEVETTFGDIGQGELFASGEEVFMKAGSSTAWNAVQMTNGELWSFEPHAPVKKVEHEELVCRVVD